MKTYKDIPLEDKKRIHRLYFHKMYSIQELVDYFRDKYTYTNIRSLIWEIIDDGYPR